MWPVAGLEAPPIGSVADVAEWTVPTPPDIESLRKNDAAAAQRWRDQQRADLRKVFGGSWRITGLTKDGSYAVTKG
jgi:predicted GNAT superfamily acetyltransferase